MIDQTVIHFVTALGIGLLIGAERERRKGARSAAGIRTFTLAALAGATAKSVGGDLLLAVMVAVAALFCAVAYYRQMAAPPKMTPVSRIPMAITASPRKSPWC